MTQVTNIPYDELQVGQKASFSSSATPSARMVG